MKSDKTQKQNTAELIKTSPALKSQQGGTRQGGLQGQDGRVRLLQAHCRTDQDPPRETLEETHTPSLTATQERRSSSTGESLTTHWTRQSASGFLRPSGAIRDSFKVKVRYVYLYMKCSHHFI